MLKTKNQIYQEALLSGDISKLPQVYNPYNAQANQSAIRAHNRQVDIDNKLIVDMKRAAGEVVPDAPDNRSDFHKAHGLRFKDEGRDVLGELIYGKQ